MDNRFSSGKPSKIRRWLLASFSAFALLGVAAAASKTSAIEGLAEEAASSSQEQSTSSSEATSTTSGPIVGDQVSEVSAAEPGTGIPQEAHDVENNLIASLTSSTSTPNMQSYSVTFSSRISTISNRYRQAYVTVDDPSFAGDIQAPTDPETGEVTLPEYTGSVYQIEIASGGPSSGDTVIEIPAQLTKNGYYIVDITNIYANAINPESAASITEIWIPEEIVSAAADALVGLSATCKIYLEADEVPETFEEGWTDALPENIITGAEITYTTETASSQNKDFGTGASFILGYDAGDKAPIKPELLRVSYDVVNADGTRETLNRLYPINITTNGIFYNAAGDTVGQVTMTRNIDIPLEEGQSVDDESIVFSNIYEAIRDSNGKFAPNLEAGSYYAQARIAYTNKLELSDFASIEFDHLATFSGYTGIVLKIQLDTSVYQRLNPSIYLSQESAIASGRCYIRFRMSSLNDAEYAISYLKDGEIVETSISVFTPLASFVMTGEKTIGFLIKNTEIGEGFKTSEMKGFGIYNLGITLDIMNTETHQAIGHSSVSTRFGYLNVEQVDADSKLPTDNLDSTLILTTIIYAAIMIAAIIATYFYKKIKFKNDEFRRLNPSLFAKNAILAFFLVGFIVLFVTFCIMRWGFLDNTLVVYNPTDAFVIAFGIAAILSVGYYVRYFAVAIKNEMERRKAIKLKLDSDVNDDDGTK